jgi:hypothetical protein
MARLIDDRCEGVNVEGAKKQTTQKDHKDSVAVGSNRLQSVHFIQICMMWVSAKIFRQLSSDPYTAGSSRTDISGQRQGRGRMPV